MSEFEAKLPVPTRGQRLIEGGTSSPIQRLPPEILENILSLICDVKPSACPARLDPDHPSRDTDPFSREPIILSHVCSNWRQITISQASFWSHIDIFPYRTGNPVPSERLEAYMARSAQTPLDIHFVIPYFKGIPANSPRAPFSPLLKTAAPRIRSLTLQSAGGVEGSSLCTQVLSTCLANRIPGTLSTASIEAVPTNNWEYSLFQHTTGIGVSYIEATNEGLWLPVTCLHLTNFLVNWNSKAYHGLTELRLVCLVRPKQSEFLSILVSSPQLRVLAINGLRGVLRDHTITPVPLNNLEILVLTKVQDTELRIILQLIAPGPKPLTLSIMCPYQDNSDFVSRDALQSFVARSNITRLCASEFKSYPQLAEVLSLMPNLRVLAVDKFTCDAVGQKDIPPTTQKLDALYIMNSTRSSFTWPSVEKFVKNYEVRELILWRYDFTRWEFGQGDEETIPGNLHTICPVVRLVPETKPNPIEEWY